LGANRREFRSWSSISICEDTSHKSYIWRDIEDLCGLKGAARNLHVSAGLRGAVSQDLTMVDIIGSVLGALGVGSFLGAFFTNWLAERRERAKRRVEFCTRQLQEFYGPLLGLHKEIRARSELRVKIQGGIDQVLLRTDVPRDARDILLKQIQEEGETFRNVLMPCYREMLKIFREKIWLAEPETRIHLATLIEFIDVWEKILACALPREIAPAIGHTEGNLKLFYSHLEATHDRLRKEIRS
jgi:hypothetical protein